MDEENYQIIIRKIEKYPNKYRLKKGKLYRLKPNNKELLIIKRFEMKPILSLAYDHPLFRHFGIESTLTKLKEKYYWPKMKNDIKNYIQTYDQCQRCEKFIDKNELYLIKVKEPFY